MRKSQKMKAFEFDGEKYKKASKHQREWGNSLIEEISLKGNESILDLGCGDGGLTEQMACLVPDGKVLGIDASEGMIETARKRVRANLEFLHMDINEIDFQNQFDVIFSNAALHWVKDHRRLLSNVFSALRKGGIIAWDFGGDGNCANFYGVIRKMIQSEKYKKYFMDFEWPWYMPSRAEYEKLIVGSGFSDYTITEVNRDRYFADADEIIKWIDQPSIVPFLREVPEEVKPEFREAVIQAVLEKTLQPDGTCFETFRRIHVKGGKN